jgi:hypothetical protein
VGSSSDDVDRGLMVDVVGLLLLEAQRR